MSSDRDDVETDRGASSRALPVFNGRSTSFPIWKARVRAWLQAATPSLLYVLEENTVGEVQEVQMSSSSIVAPASGVSVSAGGNVKVKKKEGKQSELDRLKVYNMLISSLDDAHVGMIVTEIVEGDAMGAWKILLRKYERNTLASRNQLRRELHSLKLGVGESVDEYKSRTMHIVGRLRSSKENVSDGEILYCMLEGLPVGYAMVRQAMEVQDVVDVEEACGHLREVEDKLRRAMDVSISNGSGSEVTSSESSSGVSGINVVQDTRLMRMSEERNRSSRARKCLVCGRGGHVAYECSKRCYDGCYRCGGRHRVWECDEDYVESGDSEVEDGSFNGKGRRIERRKRPQTPMN
jgi:hypothetical protein